VVRERCRTKGLIFLEAVHNRFPCAAMGAVSLLKLCRVEFIAFVVVEHYADTLVVILPPERMWKVFVTHCQRNCVSEGSDSSALSLCLARA
jgi:hypothetical protein